MPVVLDEMVFRRLMKTALDSVREDLAGVMNQALQPTQLLSLGSAS